MLFCTRNGKQPGLWNWWTPSVQFALPLQLLMHSLNGFINQNDVPFIVLDVLIVLVLVIDVCVS